MDEDVYRISGPEPGGAGESQVLRTLRQRLNDALLRVAQLDERKAAHQTSSAQPDGSQNGESWNTRPLSLPRDTLAGTALNQAISIMSNRVPTWDGSYVRVAAQTLQTLGKTPARGGYFTVDAATMLAASHAIEHFVVNGQLDCELYVGFQRMTLFRPQLRRYAQVLDSARYVYVFAIDDIPSGVPIFRHPRLIRFVITPQAGAGLLWFWFVLVSHPQFSTVLLAQQASGELFQRQLGTRTYRGFWTFDAPIAQEIMGVLRDVGRSLYYGPNSTGP